MNLLCVVLIVVFIIQVLGNPQGTYYNERANQGGNLGNFNNGNSGSYQQRPQQQQRPEYNSGSGSYSNAGSSGNSGSLGSSGNSDIGSNQTGNGTDLDSRFGLFGGQSSGGLTGMLQNLINRPSSSGSRPNNLFGGSSGENGYGSSNSGFGGFGNNYGNNRNEYENTGYNQGGYRNPSSPIREIASNIFGNRGSQTEEQSGGLFGSASSSSSPWSSILSGVANFATRGSSGSN